MAVLSVRSYKYGVRLTVGHSHGIATSTSSYWHEASAVVHTRFNVLPEKRITITDVEDRASRANAFGQCVSTTGQWIEDRTKQPMYPPDPELLTSNYTDPYPSNIFWWQTNPNCPLMDWDRLKFCRLLRGRNIMLVGDSLARQMLAKMAFSVLSRGYSPICPDRGQLICNGMPDIKEACVWGIRNDVLSLRNDSIDDKLRNIFEHPWHQQVLERNISILILNKGAHYQSDELFVPQLNETVSFIDTLPSHVFPIWRNTVAGHMNCQNYSRPITERQTGVMPFNWEKFQHQNELAHEIIKMKPRFIHMDVETMTSLRPDHHSSPPRDCLHYSSGLTPSPVDFWVLLFYNILAVIDE